MTLDPCSGGPQFLLQLSNPLAGILADAQGVGTILDDDGPVFSASKSDALGSAQ